MFLFWHQSLLGYFEMMMMTIAWRSYLTRSGSSSQLLPNCNQNSIYFIDDRMMMKALLMISALLFVAGASETANATKEDQVAAKSIPLPEPVNVSHGVGVSQGGEVPRVEIDHDGIPVIHGVVMPDDPSDKTVWRNARVLNNKLQGRKELHQTGSDLFIYRPQENPRILSSEDQEQQQGSADGSFRPSQVDSAASPYPAFYYQDYYQDKSTQEPQQLPDTVAIETSDDTAQEGQDEADAAAQQAAPADAQTDGRGFKINNKYKKTGLIKQTPGSTIGSGYARPISYYVQPDEAKAIHDDRSPYDYEPAQQQAGTSYYTNDYSASKQDQYPTYQQQQQQVAPQRQGLLFQQNGILAGSSVVPAPADSFVIRDQTYNAGGQSFSVPIPVPKDQYFQQQQQPQYGPYTQYPQYQYQYDPQQYAGQQQHQFARPQFQQPLDFLSTKFKEQVQKAKDMIHDMTDPVVDPLMEAGQKISTNLGLPERVHKINEKVATPSVLVPLAMAGGAALALGGLGTAIALSNSNSTDAAFKKLGLKNSQLADRLSTFKIKVKRSADGEVDEPAAGRSDEYDDEKENLLDRVMSSLNGPQRIFLAQLQRTGFDQWQKTPCAKRIFCDVMVRQSDDAISLMEKRMSTFLTL